MGLNQGYMGRLVVGALVAAVIVPAPVLAAGVTATFTGRSSQGKSLRLVVKRGAIKRGSRIPYTLTCHHGRLGGTLEPYGPIRHTRFSVTIHNAESVGGGYRADVRALLKIRIGSRRVSGAIEGLATVMNSKRTVVDQCGAAILFTARRER
jgi:hypothetical protein